MKFGVSMPIRGPLCNAAEIRTLAGRAEALGYDYLTVSDHIAVPTEIDSSYPYSETGDFPWAEGGDVECLEQFTLLFRKRRECLFMALGKVHLSNL